VLAEMLARATIAPRAMVLDPAGAYQWPRRSHGVRTALDLVPVSKITLPWNSESGYSAVAFDGSVHLNEPLVWELGLSEEEVEAGVARTREKVARRNAALRENRSYCAVTDSDVVLVDDGLASGFTLRAAIAALRATGVATITVAVLTAHQSPARATPIRSRPTA
jgi:predicted phosphoribosyltransferase